MTPEEYFSGLIQSGTEYHEAMKATQMYFPHWSPAPSQPYGATAPLTCYIPTGATTWTILHSTFCTRYTTVSATDSIHRKST